METGVSDVSEQARKMRYSHVRGAEAPKLQGRRSYVEYRDLGVMAASGGWMRAQFVGRRTEIAPPTGWHYHTADAQIIYFLQGWAELVFEDGNRIRGDCTKVTYLHAKSERTGNAGTLCSSPWLRGLCRGRFCRS